MDRASLTPMLRQYFEIKEQHPDTLLFFRLGDFYEMFFDDARIAAPLLEVVLTSRNKGSEDSVPMCGIPYHAMENYAAKLLRQGFKIAICDQMEDPALAKGLVRREVTRILTPGTALEIDGSDTLGENRVIAFGRDESGMALAVADLDAGECRLRFFPAGREDRLRHELVCQPPREVLVPQSLEAEISAQLAGLPELEGVVVSPLDESEFNRFEGEAALKEQFGLATIEGLGVLDHPVVIGACGALLRYLGHVRRMAPKNLSVIRFQAAESHLILDPVSFRNLEVTANLRTGT
ncbi:MAG TPA: DNA mismatch repair protein MutS, partial [Candidatus Aminicenantes bacterium]|nr:DNA mismatch repair protein MutS [Candidatus Aminicenantes bacterium]